MGCLICIAILLQALLPALSGDAAADRSAGQATSGVIGSPEENSTVPVHVYVKNEDDDSLEVSLFIDSDLKETKTVSSGSEGKFDVYPLQRGDHSFRITWWDEDVKRSCEAEERRTIDVEAPVNLYTISNSAPEKFDISVQIENENKRDLEAYLYVDDSFKKSKSVSKESRADMGSVSLEEGSHNLSVRWRDKDTGIEYEKRRRIEVSRDDIVVLYLPEGLAFEPLIARPKAERSEEERPEEAETSSARSFVNSTNATSSGISSTTGQLTEEAASTGQSRKSAGTFAATSRSEGRLGGMDELYLYLIMAALALYLIYRN